MKAPVVIAAVLGLGACVAANSLGETIHSTDIYLKYTFQDASAFAAAGGPVEVYGAPQDGASPEAVAAAIRLPAYLTPNQAKAVEPGQGGYRVALVFAPRAGLSGEKVCKGDAKGGRAGANTRILAVFCRSETAILSEARLETSAAFTPGMPAFQTGVKRLLREIMPLSSPFFQGKRSCRRGGC